MLGDFNINLHNQNDTITVKFLDLLNNNSFLQLTKCTTHTKGGLLDLVIIDRKLSINSSIVEVDTSFRTDHFPITMKLICDESSTKETVDCKFVRELHKLDMKQFSEDLKTEQITKPDVISKLTATECVINYNCTLTNLLNKHCPLVLKKYRSNRNKSKWFNSHLQNLKQKRRQAERRYKKNTNDKNKEELKIARNHYNFEIKQTRTKFYNQKITESLSNSRNLYRVLGNLTGNTKSKSLPNKEEGGKAVAEMMSDFYIDKINNIRKQIDVHNIQERKSELHKCDDTNLPEKNHFTTFSQITYSDLKEIMLGAKSKTCKLDPIPTTIVKQSFHLLYPILLRIINFSLQNNIFPDLLKNALVTPVIKSESKDPEAFHNYRPIQW